MDLDLGQLRALRAAVDHGSLDGAARALHLTPSAVSQRIKALEQVTGRVLLVRTKPVAVTAPGRAVLRLARQLELLGADAARELVDEPGRGPVPLAVAVNADSLATWLLPALAVVREQVLLHLHRADQDATTALLRDGTVVAAVTTAAKPVPGCTSTPLGTMRYRPVGFDFVAEHFAIGTAAQALGRAPVVHYDRDDDLQQSWLRRRTRGRADPPAHYVPSTDAFAQAVLAGFGWGMFSELQLSALPPGAVTLLDPTATVDVRLHWQRWKLRSPSLDAVSEAVLAGGRHALRRR